MNGVWRYVVKKRFIIVGAGNRGINCWAKGLLGFEKKGSAELPQRADLVALVEKNTTRGRTAAREIKRPELPGLPSGEEAQELTKADWGIVTTPDYMHGQTVIEALESGLNVLVDKPLATSVWECDQIIAASKRTGK